MSDPAVFLHDLDNVTVNFLGVDISGGFADGEGISIARPTAAYITKQGATGDLIRCATKTKYLRVSITYHAKSRSNTLLTGIHTAELLKPGIGQGVLIISDNNSTETYISGNAWISELPEGDIKQEVGTRKWTIDCLSTVDAPGGV